MEYSPKKMQQRLEESGFYFKKNFGQNFIIDENVIDSIIAKADIDKETMVMEIGPGAGSLTFKLCQVAQYVLCYEIDERLQRILPQVVGNFQNVKILWKDFLTASVVEDLKMYTYQKLYVVANLPYYITTPIIMKFIEDHIMVDKMILMVQKEVGDRLKAMPGTRDYGSLSVFLQYYFDVKKLMDISRNVFLPKPNVDSIIIELRKKEQLPFVSNEKLFFQLIKDSFKQKRKNLRNNLKNYRLDIVEEVLQKKGYSLSVRAEQLELSTFIELANALDEVEKHD